MDQPARTKAESGAVAREENLVPVYKDADGVERKKRILTGDRTTGKLHLGHYVGSLKARVKLQSVYDTFILMADVQALTTHWEQPEILKESVMDVALDYMAVGLDPYTGGKDDGSKPKIVVQSQVPAIAELTVLYGLLTPMRLLLDNPTTKTEAQQYGLSIDAQAEGDAEFPVDVIDSAAAVRSQLMTEYPELGTVSDNVLHQAMLGIADTDDVSLRQEMSTAFEQSTGPVIARANEASREMERIVDAAKAHSARARELRKQADSCNDPALVREQLERSDEELAASQAMLDRFDSVHSKYAEDRSELLRFVSPDEIQLSLALLDAAANLGVHIPKTTIDDVSQRDAQARSLRYAMVCLELSSSLRRALRNQLVHSTRRTGLRQMSYGFLGYPISQTADITFVNAHLVPVGVDQVPLIELCRKVVHRFNKQYGGGRKILVEPQALLGSSELIRGIDGKGKMSKSLNNAIYLSETDEEIWKKIKPAPTDPQRIKRTDPGRPEVCNIFSYHQAFCQQTEPGIDEAALGVASVEEVAENCRGAKWGCVDCKSNLAKKLTALLDPMRERRADWEKRPDDLKDVLKAGTQRGVEEGEKTLAKVKEAMHVGYW
ncbi:hypothetical protein IIA79_04775 [bacterium]|nr:hypothetical protein [bacterium]